MLARKVDTLTKAMEVEAKKMRREVAAMEKEVASMRVDKEHENRAKRFGGGARGPANSSQPLPARYVFCCSMFIYIWNLHIECKCLGNYTSL